MGVRFDVLGAENPLVAVLAVLTLTLDIGLLGALFYHLMQRTGYKISYVERSKERLKEYYLPISLFIASAATAGSLYMSNVLGWTPCKLCWYQRIFMYPLILVLGVGLVFSDENVRDYAIPLALLGFPIAFYHSLHQRFEQFGSAGCSITAVSCSTEYTFWFGYITIPVMAATAFAAVLVLMWRFGGER